MMSILFGIVIATLIIYLICVLCSSDGKVLSYYRKMKTPPCSECKYCFRTKIIDHNFLMPGIELKCNCPSYLTYLEKLYAQVRENKVFASEVRGTRFCKFEQKETEEK